MELAFRSQGPFIAVSCDRKLVCKVLEGDSGAPVYLFRLAFTFWVDVLNELADTAISKDFKFALKSVDLKVPFFGSLALRSKVSRSGVVFGVCTQYDVGRHAR